MPLVYEYGHTQNKYTKTEPICGSCAEKHATSAHLCRVGGCPSNRGILCRRYEIFKCRNCLGAHPARPSGCTYARRARQAAREAKKDQQAEKTNELVENEFNMMSVVSFEIVEEDVMEGGLARMAILTNNRKKNQVKIAAAPTFWKQHPLQTIKC
jgi:hypothetical protein